MNEVIYTASTEELRQLTNCLMPSIGKSTHPWMKVIQVRQDNRVLSWVSTDGYRITQISRFVAGDRDIEDTNFEAYIPSFIIRALRSSKESFSRLYFFEGGNTYVMWSEDALTSCKIHIETVADHFPPAGGIIPKKSKAMDVLNTDDLKESLKDLGAINKSREFAFEGSIDFTPGHLSFTLNNGGSKRESTVITCPVEERHDPPLTTPIGFNFKYLQDLVKTLKAPKLRIGWNGPLGPIKIESYETVEGEDWHMEGVIMPLRIT